MRVTRAGGKLWQLKLRIGGRERKLLLGRNPGLSRSEACKRRDTAREQVALGGDPVREKQREKIRAKLSVYNASAAIATGNLCAVQILHGHTKFENTVDSSALTLKTRWPWRKALKSYDQIPEPQARTLWGVPECLLSLLPS